MLHLLSVVFGEGSQIPQPERLHHNWFVNYLRSSAYVHKTLAAIDGTSFCSAAQKAFSIIANNVLRVAAINSVGAFVLFLGKIGVMAATCAVSVVWLKVNELVSFFAWNSILNFPWKFVFNVEILLINHLFFQSHLMAFARNIRMNVFILSFFQTLWFI